MESLYGWLILIGFVFVLWGLWWLFWKLPVRIAQNNMDTEHQGNGADVICGMIGILILTIIISIIISIVIANVIDSSILTLH